MSDSKYSLIAATHCKLFKCKEHNLKLLYSFIYLIIDLCLRLHPARSALVDAATVLCSARQRHDRVCRHGLADGSRCHCAAHYCFTGKHRYL